ncbi:MAG: hypothetical protein IJU21_00150 [Bacteroidales bacterium]|nr:hypothetical protein [Bacteroidales bacterium]
MKIILALILALMPLQATSPKNLYEEYITPETRELLDQFDKVEKDIEEAENAARARRTSALVLSVIIGLIPLGVIGRRIIRGKTWKDNPYGTAKSFGIAILGGLVLFGLNYGIFTLKFRMGDAFNTTLAFLLVAAIIVGAVWLLTKK